MLGGDTDVVEVDKSGGCWVALEKVFFGALDICEEVADVYSEPFG